MKKLFYFLMLGVTAMAVSACSDDNKGVEIKDYVVSATVLNKEVGEIKIDNFIYQVDMEIVEEQSRSDVRIKLELAEGVAMVSPSEVEAEYDLQSAATFSIVANGKTFTYKIASTEIGELVGPYKGWPQCLEFGELPSGVRIYKSPAQLQGKNAVAYIAVAKTGKGRTIDVVPSGTKVGSDVRSMQISGAKTPTQFYNDGSYPVIINGGFSGVGSSVYNYSLIWRESKLVFSTSLDVYLNSVFTVPYYPTRGIFGHIQGTDYRAEWAWTDWQGKTYAYPAPAPAAQVLAQEVPSATYPAGGREYVAQSAIGGGPVLIKGGNLATADMWADELTAADILTGSAPRTAIGYTDDNKIIFFVCEGRNATPNTPGFTLTEMANILKDLGCVEALNLDGGGSSCMLVNGHETIKLSDGSQRAVTSAVVLK
jgi:hypothetical protein